jgi:hypothetical protein
MTSVHSWWQARPEMAHVEDFGAKYDYASFRRLGDIRVNRKAIRFLPGMQYTGVPW